MMDWVRYIGIPWEAGGRSFDGADCWGLVWLFYKHELHIDLDSYDDAYGAECDAAEVGELIAEGKSLWRRCETPSPGDVAVLKRDGHLCHVGIIAPRRHLLHVESSEAPSVLARVDRALAWRIGGRTYRWRG